MILQKGDKRRERYLKDGDVLRRMRDVGGGGKGCMAGGITLLVFAVLLGAPSLLASLKAALVVGGFFGIPGLLLILLGRSMQKKKLKNYLSYYQEATGFDEQELKKVEQEIMAPDMIMIGNVPEENRQGASEKNPQISCMITAHYFVAPMLMGESYIRRIEDMILATYSQEIPGTGGYKHGLVFLSKKDMDAYMNAFLTREVCGEVIRALQAKKPDLITSQRFEYGGRKFDVITDGKEIARVFESGKILA